MDKRERKLIDDLCLMDDDFMSVVFDSNIEFTEFFLSFAIPNIKLKVTEVATQKKFKNIPGSDVILDVIANDANGNIYDIEIQNTGSIEEISKRANYYISLLTIREKIENHRYKDLHNKFVIFCLNYDIMNLDMPIYNEVCMINGKYPVLNGRNVIYMNMSYKKNDSYGKFAHDFKSSNYEGMYYTMIKEVVKDIKEGRKGDMCEKVEKWKKELAEEYKEEYKAKGKAEGKADMQFSMVNTMLKNGMTKAEIAKVLSLSLNDIENILKYQVC